MKFRLFVLYLTTIYCFHDSNERVITDYQETTIDDQNLTITSEEVSTTTCKFL